MAISHFVSCLICYLKSLALYSIWCQKKGWYSLPEIEADRVCKEGVTWTRISRYNVLCLSILRLKEIFLQPGDMDDKWVFAALCHMILMNWHIVGNLYPWGKLLRKTKLLNESALDSQDNQSFLYVIWRYLKNADKIKMIKWLQCLSICVWGVCLKSYFQECLKVGLITAIALNDFIMEKLFSAK